MKKELIEAMQNDMRIFPYIGESEKQLCSRLVYSGIAQWLRCFVLDSSDSQSAGKSKKYLYSRGKEVLDSFCDAAPELKDWFCIDEAVGEDDPIRNIREKMICANEFVEDNLNSSLLLPVHHVFSCGDNVEREVGLSGERISCEYVGVTRIKQSKDSIQNNEKSNESDEVIRQLFDKASYSKMSDGERMEFFNPHSSDVPYKSWEDNYPKRVGYTLGRVKLFNDYYEHYFVKFIRGICYVSKLPQYFEKIKEDRKILLWLRKENGNPIAAEYEYKNGVVLLFLHCRLPQREESIIETFSWPYRFYNDKLQYVIPFKVWDMIQRLLVDDMCIELQEK